MLTVSALHRRTPLSQNELFSSALAQVGRPSMGRQAYGGSGGAPSRGGMQLAGRASQNENAMDYDDGRSGRQERDLFETRRTGAMMDDPAFADNNAGRSEFGHAYANDGYRQSGPSRPDFARAQQHRELLPGSSFAAPAEDAPAYRDQGSENGRPQLRMQGSAAAARANDQLRAAAKESIFSRLSVPNPHAPEFVPNGKQEEGPSLFDRLGPKAPDDYRPPPPPVDLSSFPSKPTDKSACRFLLKCTNPLCTYSHPTPCLANTPKEDEAMMLSEEACFFGAKCSKPDCTRSHVSPAVSVLASRQGNMQQMMLMMQQQAAAAAMMMPSQWSNFGQQQARPVPSENDGRPPPCKFQKECTNVQCAYSHYNDEGKIMPSPALARLAQQSRGSRQINGGGGAADTAASVEISNGDAQMNGDVASKDTGSALDRPLEDSSASRRPCKFGVACTRTDCIYSHPMGRKFDGSSNLSSSSTLSAGTTPCRFGAACFRPDCHFSHPPGRLIAQHEQQTRPHVSERLGRFSKPSAEGDVERIIPATS